MLLPFWEGPGVGSFAIHFDPIILTSVSRMFWVGGAVAQRRELIKAKKLFGCP